MSESNTPPEEPTEEPDPQPTPFPTNGFEKPKSNLLFEMERFADIINALGMSHGLQPEHALSLLNITLNYNLTLRQMGLMPPPQSDHLQGMREVDEEIPDGSEDIE